MKVLNCAAARRRLQAYHDEELPISDQIDLSAHLEWCDECARELRELQMTRAMLRMRAPGRVRLSQDEAIGLQSAVVARWRAERAQSWPARVRAMFDDMHMIYAGMGAMAATVACVMVLFSMMRFATSEKSPGSNQNPVVLGVSMMMPRALDQSLMTTVPSVRNPEDTVFTLSAVVTREGRIVNLEVYSEDGDRLQEGSVEAQAAKNFVGAVQQARFEPARVSGLPVAVNMVWMVAHTTVRGAPVSWQAPIDEPVATTSIKKRRVDVELPPDRGARPSGIV